MQNGSFALQPPNEEVKEVVVLYQYSYNHADRVNTGFVVIDTPTIELGIRKLGEYLMAMNIGTFGNFQLTNIASKKGIFIKKAEDLFVDLVRILNP